MIDNTLILKSCKASGKMGSLNSPIYRSSTIAFDTLDDYISARLGDSKYGVLTDGEKRNHGYSNVGTPTCQHLANLLCLIEGGNCSGLIYPNGLTALTSTVLALAGKDSHVLVQDNCYSMFKNFMLSHAVRLGIQVTVFNPLNDISRFIQKNTCLIMMESPGSYTFEITDIDKIVSIAKRNGIITAIDNSWGGPFFFKPLEYGVDVSIYSVTKYINGHSDLLMGASFSTGEVFRKMNDFYFHFGISVSSDDCYLVQRGVKTAKIRVERHQRTAIEIADWLKTQKKVSNVLFPALPSHPQHELWKKYFTGTSSLFGFILDKKYSTVELSRAMSKMSVFSIGASWGGCESVILPCLREDNLNIAPREHIKMEDKTYIRIFCGLEEPHDLIQDLDLFLSNLS